jgi:hypothetical protein
MVPQLNFDYHLQQFTLNKPQWRSYMTLAKVIVNVWSRGTGKTFYQAVKILILIHVMPRGLFALVGRTLDQMVQNTLPFMFDALGQLGYTEWNGKTGHYVIGKRPPEHWPKPYATRLKYEKSITFYTGATFMLISQERAGSGRGPSIDAILADEGLMLKAEQLRKEVFAANRGPSKWGDTPYHHSIEIWSSMPFVGMGQWLKDYAKYYEEEFQIDIIKQNNDAANLMLQFIDSPNPKEEIELWGEIAKHLTNDPYKVSSKGIYYNEAVVFDNIKNLGWAYIKMLRSTMLDTEFKVEVLNMAINLMGDKFYHLDEELLYDPPSYYEERGLEGVSLHSVKPYDLDTDVVRHEPLDIACDANASINTLVVGQHLQDEYRVLNGLFVKKPKWISHNAQLFCDYYANHPKKEVNFFYDHTFVGVDAGRPVSFADQYIEVFQKNGWNVNAIYIGQAAGHLTRYEVVNKHLQQIDGRTPIVFNRMRTKDLWTALDSTGIRTVNGETKKDKRPEGDSKVKQEHAPHFSDAFDTLVVGRLVQHNHRRTVKEEDFSGLTIGS